MGTVRGHGIYERRHLSDGEQEAYWWGRIGGGGGGGGSVDFTFRLSEVSGPQREHSSYVVCMCGCIRVMTFHCALLVTSVLVTATKHDGYAWFIMQRKKYENCLLRAASSKCAV